MLACGSCITIAVFGFSLYAMTRFFIGKPITWFFRLYGSCIHVTCCFSSVWKVTSCWVALKPLPKLICTIFKDSIFRSGVLLQLYQFFPFHFEEIVPYASLTMIWCRASLFFFKYCGQ